MVTEEKKQQVKKILLTPIECTTQESVNIFRHNGIIYSSQRYSGALDPDMSDIAVEFYNIVYRDILEPKKILKEEGFYKCTLENFDFAGDTMNSFNSIADNVPGAGQSAKRRTEKNKWQEEFLQDYHSQYHCLANFWILPWRIGRKRGTKLNNYDSVDIFLNKLEEDFNVLKEYADYFERLKTYDNFCVKHFIVGCELLPTDAVNKMYSTRLNNKPKAKEKLKEDSQNLVEQAYKVIESRAESIASNNYVCDELYEHFNELKILY